MAIIKKNIKNRSVIKIDGFEIPGVLHFSTLKNTNKKSESVDDLANTLNLEPNKLAHVKQVHSNRVIKISKISDIPKLGVEADGMVTNITDIGLVTYHADCTPLYFYDLNAKVIGLAHSGWKGTLSNICHEIVECMKNDFGSDVKDIVIGIGPCISVDHYEFDELDITPFRLKYKGMDVVKDGENKPSLNLIRANEVNALNEGILAKNIFIADYCTYENMELCSFRRDKNRDNFYAFMSLVQE